MTVFQSKVDQELNQILINFLKALGKRMLQGNILKFSLLYVCHMALILSELGYWGPKQIQKLLLLTRTLWGR